jgi:hypothetical protein
MEYYQRHALAEPVHQAGEMFSHDEGAIQYFVGIKPIT